ncbi:MAG TPA: sigma-54 dependent transcriptional regulator [Steroidobacteraceae bacterium]|jgi:sigma-54 specific flagellar transcriptional regulator A|nr:sigma-54 dependent transcriptional regulator [Steroidobacteraceae bacterium]
MAESAALTGAFVNAAARHPYEIAASSVAILPTGTSALIRHVNHLIGQVAAFDSNVLILGESGTGKEVVARAIHQSSPRRARTFVPINCGAIPAELLESELFGHEKGAFTGALAARKGRFEIAEGGTIFLDEIGDMNPTMQVKLLRVLQERVFERVGSCVSQRCDVRIIAATHHDLEQSIAKGTFREDLFYRLNVVPIEMPPLRDRGEDLPLLVADLVQRIGAAGRPPVQFAGATIEALKAYRWPGNVRELGNLIERMSIQCGTRAVTIADLPARYRPLDFHAASHDAPVGEELIASAPAISVLGPALDALAQDGEADNDERSTIDPQLADALLDEIPSDFDLRGYLESLEQRLIVRAMRIAGGTVAQAARLLGLRRTTLVEKLRKYSLAGSDTAASET